MARRRNPRVDRDVRAAIADILETELSDPRLDLVSITGVEVTPDQDVAVVLWSTPDPGLISSERGAAALARPDQVTAALESAAPRIRSLLGRRVKLRLTPELRFRPDPMLERADRVERLLLDLDREADAPDSAAPADAGDSAAPDDAGDSAAPATPGDPDGGA